MDENDKKAAAVGGVVVGGVLAYLLWEELQKKKTTTPTPTPTPTPTSTGTIDLTASVSQDPVGAPITLTATTSDPTITTIYFFVQAPDGSWQTIGSAPVSGGSAQISYTPESPGVYTFEASSGATPP